MAAQGMAEAAKRKKTKMAAHDTAYAAPVGT